ncbi:neural cell adhesion molecule 1a isoform X3 [Megalops cyprinoides]|uniref:neural cell adhesion molecule 1a isoform X3 n=1 Tax=Megalops cyprinoides TaxID=118141 RepID=UPI001864FE4E|nr:neural cell adhesion molecule 1a isoform X3 [Megalops cyprinoides]
MLQTRVLIWALLFFSTAASLQVEITPKQGEISMGESKFFLCSADVDAKDIDWFAPNGDKILPNGQDIIVTRNDEMSSTLTIYNADVDQAGTYKCVAKNGDKEAQATVNVKIFQKLTFKNAPSPQEFTEGDDADIVCDVVSSPPPTIIWKHKGSKIQVEKDVRFKILSNNHLQIRGIKKTDEGDYTCEGRILARGEIDYRIIKVIVNVFPSIRPRHSEQNATADMGHSVMLACDADGYPEPNVTWARNNVVLESNDKYSLNEDGSELIIKDVKKVDAGEYICIAKNKAGTKEQEVSLNVFVQPKITFLENQTASELEELITLTCEATGDPTPSIVWSFGRHVFTEGEQASWTRPEKHKSLDGNVVVRSDARVSSLTLKYVQFTDAGQYLCTARNSIGFDSQAMYLEVRYAPKIQGSVAVYTWEGNPANISCEVLAHPGATVVWFREGQQLPSPNITSVKIFNTPAVSYLEVTPETQTEFGSYNCTATNVIGTESKEFLLIQADVPSAPSIEHVEPYSSSAHVEFDEPDASGGVPILKYKAEWRVAGQGEWTSREYEAEDGMERITIVGLRPETSYEVKMSAINGKGEGDSSAPEVFKTEPVREPSPPKLEAKLQSTGNALKVNWIKQDDGGSPIRHYLVRYKAKHVRDWKPEIRLPSSSEYVVLSGLAWNTEYEVYVVAENMQGKSQPGIISLRTSPEPTTIPDSATSSSGLGTGAIVGILIIIFVLLLVGVDVTCYFLNKCGLLMCIAVNFCGKSGPGAKSKDIEEGKAAFTKDESKEPIVEVRTEEERTPNHEGGGQTEPNETTPLTEPEHAADTTATVVDLLPSVTTNSDTVTETFATAQNSPTSETTTLASSTGAPATDAKTAPIPQSSTPKASITSPSSPPTAPSESTPKVAPLVDLSDTPTTNTMEAPNAPSSLPPSVPVSDAMSPLAPTSAPEPPKADTTKGPGKEVPQTNTATVLPEPTKAPTAPDSAAKPSQNQDFQIDGGPFQSSDIDLAKDVFEALGKQPSETPADSTAPPMPAQDDKLPVDGNSKPDETEVKKTLSEVKTVPNEAAQTNGQESKA